MTQPALNDAEEAELNRLRADYATCSAALDELFEPRLAKLRRKLPLLRFRNARLPVLSWITLSAVCLIAVLCAGLWIASSIQTGMTAAYANQPPVRLSVAETDGTDPEYGLCVNTATAKELTVLPGIGPVLAARIVEEREQHGAFHYPADLLRVSGIGPKVLDRILPLISLSIPTP